MRYVVAVVVLLGVAAWIGGAQAQRQSLTVTERERLMHRMMGTWERQPDKSMVTLATPPRQDTIRFERGGENAVRLMNRGISADGTAFELEGVQVLDGSQSSLDGPYNMSVSRTPVDEYTLANQVMRGGVLVAQNTQVFSGDGLRMTIINRDANNRIMSINVFDKIASTTP